MIWSLIIFGAGVYCGHVVSPKIDEWAVDFKNWMAGIDEP